MIGWCMNLWAHIQLQLGFEMTCLCSNWWACVLNDGFVFESMGLCSKWCVCVRNDGFVFESTGLCSKWCVCVWIDGFVFGLTGSCLKWWAHDRIDGFMFEATGVHSNRRACLWTHRLMLTWHTALSSAVVGEGQWRDSGGEPWLPPHAPGGVCNSLCLPSLFSKRL